MGQNTFYVTTPIYYVNDRPHIGHAYTTILADVLSRYHRLLGDPTFFLTGTDEHGQKVQKAAIANMMTPQEQCDATVTRFQELWEKLEITHDDFIRTTEDRHKTVVRKILQELYDRGEIYKAEYSGNYCTPCERFFSKKDIVDGNLCPDCKRATDEIIESNYFFRMGQYQSWLIDYIRSHPEFIQPDFRRNETLGFLRKPLEDLCISRPKKRLAWGIELPFDREYVCYVWFDALINYITGIGYGQDAAKFAKWWPASYHLIGKDILTTHTVYWPTMLKAMGIEQPKTIYAHGWWLIGADKMSKSLGNVVNPMAVAEKYGVDAFRYFLMSEMSLGNDASFSEGIFITRYNSNLANDLGNLLSRVVKMIDKEAGGIIPAPVATAQTEFEKELRETVLSAVFEMEPAITGMKLDRGLEQIMNAIRAANRYMEKTAPWKLAKEKNTDRLNTVLYTAAESLRIISGLLYPVMPGKMCEIRKAIGLSETGMEIFELKTWGKLSPGLRVSDIGSLFPRIEVVKADTVKPAKSAETVAVAAEDIITIEDFGKIKLKTAKVLEAEKVEGADKLLRLQIEVGGQKRQLVAGIAQFYRPEEVVGRTIVIVANLKPAKIRGIESCGMLLAAKEGKTLKLITVDGGDFPSGASVG
ncbi:MAG: methionine--tRNA ligase [Victivallales bacterium]